MLDYYKVGDYFIFYNYHLRTSFFFKMDEPLVGSRENNYRFFYASSGAAIGSLLILLVVTGYTAYISTNIGNLITDMNEVVDDIRVIMPDAKNSLRIIKEMCKHENFTKAWGNIC